MAAFTNVSAVDLTILSDFEQTLEPAGSEMCPESASVVESKERQLAPLVGSDLSSAIYQQITKILREQQNFYLEGYKVLCIKRRLAARIRSAGHYDPAAYVELLQKSVFEQEQLLAALSIHVSQFFRNQSVFQVLEKLVLPELLAAARHSNSKSRFWSIGCAHGEEPYSLALLCKKQQQRGDLFSIIGTDLSSKALKKAKRGLFPAERVRGISASMLAGFFSRKGQQYQLHKQIRDLVQFFRHDILVDQPFYRANLVLCRNLLIYFSREQQRQVLEMVANVLLPGGYLVLGRAETMAPACRELFVCIDPAERIYQRLPIQDR